MRGARIDRARAQSRPSPDAPRRAEPSRAELGSQLARHRQRAIIIDCERQFGLLVRVCSTRLLDGERRWLARRAPVRPPARLDGAAGRGNLGRRRRCRSRAAAEA